MAKDNRFIFETTPSQGDDIRRIAKETGMPISELLRRAVAAFVNRYDEAAKSQKELLRPGA